MYKAVNVHIVILNNQTLGVRLLPQFLKVCYLPQIQIKTQNSRFFPTSYNLYNMALLSFVHFLIMTDVWGVIDQCKSVLF